MRRMKQRPRFYGSKTMVRRFQEIYLYFFLYCVIGWLYEVFLEVVVYRWGFSNRGILFGPYLPIYGIGALVFLLCFGRYVQKPVSYTHLCSSLWWWDLWSFMFFYPRFPCNPGNFISLPSC